MSHRPRIATIAAALLIVLAGSLPGCGSDPANPGGGGGAKELDSPTVGPAGTYVHTFPSTAGTHTYQCQIHGSSMSGSVTVAGGNPGSAAVSMTNSSTFSPASVSIDLGGTVTWTNNSGNNHTVTSN